MQKNTYAPYLDGLRGIAFLMIFSSHLFAINFMEYFGRISVIVFLFVSGFLITRLLIKEHDKNGRVSLKRFYVRRSLRLYPALILMLSTVLLLALAHHLPVYWPGISAGIFYYTNYHLVYAGFPENYPLFFDALWSLSVQEHFYLLFPLLFIGLYTKKYFVPLLALLAVGVLGIRIAQNAALSPEEYFKFSYFPTHTRIDTILIGCAAALLIFQKKSAWYIRLLNQRWTLPAGFTLMLMTYFYTHEYFQSTYAYTLYSIGLFLIIPSLEFRYQKSWITTFLTSRVMLTIGKLSYSLYLFHWVAINMAGLQFEKHSLPWYAWSVTGAFIMAALSYYMVEKPIMGLRRRFGSDVEKNEPGSPEEKLRPSPYSTKAA